MNDTSKLLIKQAVSQLKATSAALAALKCGMQRLAAELPEYPVVMQMPPNFGEVSLTPEKQEAMHKKEKRRDKLYRNYLRRKANGKQ
jgi:hypothetical protein